MLLAPKDLPTTSIPWFHLDCVFRSLIVTVAPTSWSTTPDTAFLFSHQSMIGRRKYWISKVVPVTGKIWCAYSTHQSVRYLSAKWFPFKVSLIKERIYSHFSQQSLDGIWIWMTNSIRNWLSHSQALSGNQTCRVDHLHNGSLPPLNRNQRRAR